ncbi:hypothetical protein GTP41_20080 [Pseudoduganella sp. DS3]|uniref:Uncharacterized protein n=1 Tax=Pseudoduganella guangdongensis TaxID=2692179 RepID=A0A6N9HNX9_9BURK|nr:hypothetical protein [Pseudoduganella guangdongensis]MYN04395.1 hypothetical protein [Pseudoduganella guangdongensis]
MQDSINHDAEIKVLKEAVCPSLSGRSSLTYHIGCRADHLGKDGSEFNEGISLRIHHNSGSGLFSNQWVPIASLKPVFDKEKSQDAVTSSSLSSVFAGSSVNTAGFILAVLKAEGLVVHMPEKRRYYQCTSTEQFFIDLKALCGAIADGADMAIASDVTDLHAAANGEGPDMAIANSEASTAKPMAIGKSKKR